MEYSKKNKNCFMWLNKQIKNAKRFILVDNTAFLPFNILLGNFFQIFKQLFIPPNALNFLELTHKLKSSVLEQITLNCWSI